VVKEEVLNEDEKDFEAADFLNDAADVFCTIIFSEIFGIGKGDLA
jgi:hypothetical protein